MKMERIITRKAAVLGQIKSLRFLPNSKHRWNLFSGDLFT